MHIFSNKDLGQLRISRNPLAKRTDEYPPDCRTGIDPAEAKDARALLRSWPPYKSTPLTALPQLARRLEIGSLLIKEENLREPLHSFKTLGGAFALGEDIRDHIKSITGMRPDYETIFRGEYSDVIATFVAFAATDGNHGRSLAWGADMFGCQCHIFVPRGVSEERQNLIRSLGAKVEQLDGNYEFAVATARSLAGANEHGIFIQDTSDDSYQLPCKRIMHGYTLMSEEIRDDLGSQQPPTHVFLHVGCGGMAAAVAADMWLAYGADRPTMVSVEPLSTDSFRLSVEKGSPVEVGGDHETLMVGLAVGEVSAIAWPILSQTMDFAVAISEEAAVEALNLFADGTGDDPKLTVGETGGAGLAALMQITADPDARALIGLKDDSRVLTIGTEGAVDQSMYNRFRNVAT